jgi:hypothetical protein
MSQHFFQATLNSRPVQVVIGWDRPLQGFFMTIERLDAADDEAEVLFDNARSSLRFPRSLTVFRKKLAELGIKPPAGLFHAVTADARCGVGNRIVTHFKGGWCEELYA